VFVGCLHIHFLDLRAKEIDGIDRPFGWYIVVLIGDTAQLPSVRGHTLLSRGQKRSIERLSGMHLYFNHFTSVVDLTKKKRIDRDDEDAVVFEALLDRLANGLCSTKDWKLVTKKCSEHSMSRHEWQERGFNDPDKTHLFPTNCEVPEHNHQLLFRKEKHIAKVEANNCSGKARAMKSDNFGGLQNSVYLAEDAKVLLKWNLFPEAGLANGATGVVIGFNYRNGGNAPDLQYCMGRF
jgi:hypothetical protein